MTIELSDLILAYRKAKTDYYYSSTAFLNEIVKYEKNLYDNLSSLQDRLNKVLKEKDPSLDGFELGSYFLRPCSLSFDENQNQDQNHIFSNPKEIWDLKKKTGSKPEAKFRVMARLSLDFHVLASLWIHKIGDLADKKLSKNSYGNRLRRKKDNSFNDLALGNFQPYLKPFTDWRNNGLAAIRKALDDNKKVSVLTTDIQAFYHELNPDFLSNKKFWYEKLNIELDEEQDALNKFFIKCIKSWAEETPLGKGLPVGLSASAIIANLALIAFDEFIEKEVVPLYYGRYVDDIFLVMQNTNDFQKIEDVWEWLTCRTNSVLHKETLNYKTSIYFQPSYFDKNQKNKIKFNKKKSKLFCLDGATGKALLETIEFANMQQSSEWRSLPYLPEKEEQIKAMLLTAVQQEGGVSANFGKIDKFSFKKAQIAIRLRDFEAYERNLEPEQWQAQRYAFFDVFIDYVLNPSEYFELLQYLPRVVALMTACADFAYIIKVIKQLFYLYEEISVYCKVTLKGQEVPKEGTILKENWYQVFFQVISQQIIASFPGQLSAKATAEWDVEMQVSGKLYNSLGFYLKLYSNQKISLDYIKRKHQEFFAFDLAHRPFRHITMDEAFITQRGLPQIKKKKLYLANKLDEKLLDDTSCLFRGNKTLSRLFDVEHVLHGFYFAVRPFSAQEIFLLSQEKLQKESKETINELFLALRGFQLKDQWPLLDKKGILHVSQGDEASSIHVSLTSWKTDDTSYHASAKNQVRSERKKYARFCQLLNNVLSQNTKSHYLVLPELSISAHWFIHFAQKLQTKRISLIAGVEYLHSHKKQVRNQVWSALCYDGLGYPSLFIYRQDKQRAAIHEAQSLAQISGKILKPKSRFPSIVAQSSHPFIVHHGDFYFALLICSELTNIEYRAYLRGKIDALFVIEWNQDIESFNSLVESAALDLHAYIIQCNVRQFGDSRIRAPYKEQWLRDIIRVKGSLEDYSVIGEIDIQSLRQFQSYYASPDKPFKPVPDGFKIVKSREFLPKKED